MMGGEGWTNLPEAAQDKTLDTMAPVAAVAGPHVQALVDLPGGLWPCAPASLCGPHQVELRKQRV